MQTRKITWKCYVMINLGRKLLLRSQNSQFWIQFNPLWLMCILDIWLFPLAREHFSAHLRLRLPMSAYSDKNSMCFFSPGSISYKHGTKSPLMNVFKFCSNTKPHPSTTSELPLDKKEDVSKIVKIFLQLLFQNHRASLKQTGHKASQGERNSNYPVIVKGTITDVSQTFPHP